ncbi:MAG: hypothetical protein GY946_30785, partial [bacterium]|nr:hypothetical protein [bacterium]
MTRPISLPTVYSLFLVLLLAACGGGGSGSFGVAPGGGALVLAGEHTPLAPTSYVVQAGTSHVFQFAGPSGYAELRAGDVPVQVAPTDSPAQATTLVNGTLRLPFEGNLSVTVSATDQAARITAGPGAQVALIVDRIFDRLEDGYSMASEGAIPGDVLLASLELHGMVEGQQIPGDDQDVHVQLSLLGDETGASVRRLESSVPSWENDMVGGATRRIVSFAVPEGLERGSYLLDFHWGDLRSGLLEFEVTNATYRTIRSNLARSAEQLLARTGNTHTSLVGPHLPVRRGDRLFNGMTGEYIGAVPVTGAYLFLGFEPGEMMPQERTTIVLASIGSGQVFLLDGQGSWPIVLDQNDDEWALDLGSSHARFSQYYNAFLGGMTMEINDPPAVAPQREDALTQGDPLCLRPAADEACPEIVKHAILLTLDDNEEPTSKDGRMLPRFSELVSRERQLTNDMGFNARTELGVNDLVKQNSSGYPEFDKDMTALRNALTGILADAEDPCCLELFIFVNAHQNKRRSIRYKNRNAPISRPDPLHPTAPPRTKEIKGSTSSDKIADLVAEV